MGLLQVVNSICLNVDRSYQFTHQNLQELLANSMAFVPGDIALSATIPQATG